MRPPQSRVTRALDADVVAGAREVVAQDGAAAFRGPHLFGVGEFLTRSATGRRDGRPRRTLLA